MQVHDTSVTNKHKRDTRNIHATLTHISWLFKFFALECNIERETVSPFKLLISITALVLFHGILISTSLYFKIKFLYGFVNTSIKYTDAVQTVYDYCQYVADLYFVYKYGRHISSEYYRQYDNIDKILNMASYPTLKGRLIKMTGFFTLIWLMSSACDFVAWFLNFGWKLPVIYSIAYIYLFVKILTTLDFSSHVMRIEIRLRIIGDALIYFYTKTESSTHFIGDLIGNKYWLYKDSETHSNCLKLLSNDDSVAVQWLTRCYLMLTEQVAFINTMYGIRILLNSLSILIDMVRFTNIAVRVIFEYQYFPAISSLMRLLTCIALLISLVIHCEQAYEQRQRILIIIDHILILKDPSEKLTTAMNELRTLVQNRPIVFNVANFFQLKNSLLLSITSVVVTYTIILLQSIN